MRPDQWIYTIPLRLRSLFRRRRVEQDLDEELAFHRAMLAHNGQPEPSRDFERSREECRHMRRVTPIDDLAKDFRFAVRTLRRSPLFAIAAALTLALGIGAGTAVFSVTNAVLLRPLPYRDAGRLTLVYRSSRTGALGGRNFLYSNADFFDLRDATRPLFEDIGGVAGFRAFVPREDGSMEQISKALVTTNFFQMLGAHMAIGRDFNETDSVRQPTDVQALIPVGSSAVLSYAYWQRRYAASPAVLGHPLSPGGPLIVGVLEPEFRLYFPSGVVGAEPDFWVANNAGYDTQHRNLMLVGALARLKPGISLDQARARIGTLIKQPQIEFGVQALHGNLVEDVRTAILALLGAVLFLLLIACANVANLLLVRTHARERELAMRAALGGSHWRLVRQLLVEALLLSSLGTLLGIVIAWAGVRELLRFAPASLPRIESASLDWRVLAFAGLAGLVSGVLFGLLPALRTTRPDVIGILRGSGRSGGAHGWLRNGVVMAEVALSFVLLVGAGLMLRSLAALERVDGGFDPHGLLTFYVTREWPLAKQEGRRELLHALHDRLQSIPGVESVTEALSVPLTATGRNRRGSEGSDFAQVSPGYFETLHTPLIAGRYFTPDDDQTRRNVVVIDDHYAAHAFPNQNAVGQRIEIPFPQSRWAEVIGVVKHQRQYSLTDPGRDTLYFTEGFAGVGVSRYWALRTAGDPAKYASAVRAELAKLDRALVISKVETMETLVAHDQAGTRFSLFLIGLFAAIAVVLAVIGLYGVLASAVRQRTAEIGVRMALGAAPSGIFRLMAGQGLRLAAAGIVLGLAAASVVTRFLGSMLIGVRPLDAVTFAGMTVLFLAIAALASWVPAWRAATLDPSAALREE